MVKFTQADALKRLPPLAAVLTFAMSAAHSAQAQSKPPLFEITEAHNYTFADIGASSALRESYLGSDTTETLFLPYVNATYKGRYFVLPSLGAGVHLISNDTLRLSGSVNYVLGRDGTDTPFDTPLFDLKDSITLNAATRIRLPFAALDIAGTLPVSGDIDGHKVDIFLTTQLKPFENLKINPGIRASYTSSDWLNSYYGINAEQAVATNLTQTSLDSDISSYGAHTVAYWTVTDHYEIIGSVIYSKLTGDAKNSVLSPKKDGVTVAIGFARKF